MMAENSSTDAQGVQHKLSHRRRAVHTGLAALLDKDQLYGALWLLEEEFADSPSFSLHRFLSELALRHELPGKRSELYRALVAQLIKEDNELDKDPLNEMIAWRAMQGEGSTKPGIDPSDARGSVFEGLMLTLLSEIDNRHPHDATQLRNSFYSSLELAGLELTRQHALKLLLQNGRGHLHPPLSEEQMRQILHTLYLLMCEHFGPQQADRLLSDAVADASRLPEAALYAPRQLL